MSFFTIELPAAINSALTGILTLITTFGETIISAFEPIVTVFEDLGTTVTDAFKDVTKLLDTNMKVNVDEAFSSLTDSLNGVAEPFNGLASALNGFAIDIPDFKMPEFDGGAIASDMALTFNSMTSGLWAPITDVANGFVDMFNKLKIGETRWSISAGRLGSWSGSLFPEIDLIPGTIARFQQGGIVDGLFDGTDNQLIAAQPGEFVLRRGAVSGIGEQTISEMNRTGQMPSSGGNVALNINEGAITIMQQPGESSQDMAEKIFEELKQRSINGETVIFASGIRAE